MVTAVDLNPPLPTQSCTVFTLGAVWHCIYIVFVLMKSYYFAVLIIFFLVKILVIFIPWHMF